MFRHRSVRKNLLTLFHRSLYLMLLHQAEFSASGLQSLSSSSDVTAASPLVLRPVSVVGAAEGFPSDMQIHSCVFLWMNLKCGSSLYSRVLFFCFCFVWMEVQKQILPVGFVLTDVTYCNAKNKKKSKTFHPHAVTTHFYWTNDLCTLFCMIFWMALWKQTVV